MSRTLACASQSSGIYRPKTFCRRVWQAVLIKSVRKRVVGQTIANGTFSNNIYGNTYIRIDRISTVFQDASTLRRVRRHQALCKGCRHEILPVSS